MLVDLEHAEIGYHKINHVDAGQRQCALLQELGSAILRCVFHHNDDAFNPGDEIHRAAHPLHHLAGDHPVGEVAALVHFHSAEDREVDVTAADHRERV